MRFKALIIVLLGTMLVASCGKDKQPSSEEIKILKEKEKVIADIDRVTIRGEFAYKGVIDSVRLRLGTEEHLHGSDDYGMDLSGNSFYVEITGLRPRTMYYYRYLFDYGADADWESEIYTFTTAEDGIELPTVATGEVTGVSVMAATCLCNVVDDGGSEVVERGACWSTDSNPNVANSLFANGNGLGEYTVDMEDLQPNTTYYVRAYAKNTRGFGYGEVMSFTTLEVPMVPLACVNGMFSVSDDKQVWFAQGNLRYWAATHEWGFADQAFEIVGDGNSNISENYDGPIDLFGWGTSGYEHGAVCYQPWSTEWEQANYWAYGLADYNLADQTGQADWGYGVVIDDDDALTHPWYTLTQEEWNYVFNNRATPSGVRFAKAQVEGVNGVLLLADGWTTASYALNNVNQVEASYTSNRISGVDFRSLLEPNGATFLPAAGRRQEAEVENTGVEGYYWAGTARSENRCWAVMFDNDLVDAEVTFNRPWGFSVRLVRDVAR